MTSIAGAVVVCAAAVLALDRSSARAIGFVVSALAGVAAGVAVVWLVWRFVLRDRIAHSRDDAPGDETQQ